MRKLLLFFCYLLFATPVYAASDLIGNWSSTDKTLRYDFLEGFAPKRGVVIQYKNGTPKSVDDWEVQKNKVKIGWSTKKYKIVDNNLLLEDKTFQRLTKKQPEKIIELKKETQAFIDSLVDRYWSNPIKEEIYQYKKGFSSTSGIYSIEKKKKQGSLGSWSFANGVIKIDSSVYPNGRIAGNYLLLLTSGNKIKFLKGGVKAPSFKTMELKQTGEGFIRKLVSGRWMTPSVYGASRYKEFRPIFGDLSGVIFNFQGLDFLSSSKWEYSLKTSSIKIGYTEYPNAQIQGPFLILLKKDGGTIQSIRPKGEKIKEFTHAEVKRVKVTETNTETIRSVLGRQWYKQPNTYNFIFKENGKEGWLHQFRSYPFVISGNTLNIKGLSKVKDVRLVDGKIVLGDNKASYFSDSKIVYLAHQGKEAATKLADLQKKKVLDSAKNKLVLKIKMKNGVDHRVELPVGEMKNIISLSLEPGL